MKKIIKRIFCIVIILGLVAGAGVLGVNGYVKSSVRDRILTSQQAAELSGVQCVLVLGCYVWEDGTPSPMLRDRLRRGVELYELGVAPKLLMSGDHGREDYDEVAVMKRFAVDAGISAEDVFMDHAGFSTYESIYRAKEIFGAEKILIVTQEYHLYRALYIARQLGVEAWGVSGDYSRYAGQFMRDVREILARVKDVATCMLKTEPTFLGEAIPISGSGDSTNDDTSNFY